ncbi:MAG: hypothetical protein CND43_03040 [Flavobacteriales bacterium MED-G15]|nr:MAG: hypothetical protein CND43_03040 [Flavobacteriales bacterium MED-G15]
MITKKLFLLFTLFFVFSTSAQQFDLNNIKIDDVKNTLQSVLGKTEKKTNQVWSGVPGTTNFNVADRIAINDVIDAYGVYWDSNNLEGYLSLFAEDATGVTYNSKGEKITVQIKDKRQINQNRKRMDFFESNDMQRRHMMANTLILELTESYAHLNRYMMLLTTNNQTKTEIITPIFYVFKLKKIDGVWKITYREINLDTPLDLAIKP